MNFLKNIILLVVVLFLSYFTAEYFGSWYDNFSPQYDNSFFNLPKEFAVFIAGIPVAYVFFTSLVFGFLQSKKWLLVLLIPAAILWISADIYNIYIPIILSLVGIGISFVARKILVKNIQ